MTICMRSMEMNNNELQPYDPEAPCKKCGIPGASTNYVPAQGYEFEDELSIAEAFIERECSNCGHEWREKPLDEE